jgi:hypothetical protein
MAISASMRTLAGCSAESYSMGLRHVNWIMDAFFLRVRAKINLHF